MPKSSAYVLPLLFLGLAVGSAAEAREKPGAVKWIAFDHGGRSRTFLRDGLTITTDTVVGEEPDDRVPVLKVQGPGTRSVVMAGSDRHSSMVTAEFAVVRLRRGASPVVVFRSFTGGAHCCEDYQIARQGTGEWNVLALGTWDDTTAPDPVDVDGDGSLEWVGADQRFQYRFDSYAGSLAPPVVYKLGPRGLVNVSDAPRYRRLFASKLPKYRRMCERSGENGICAGYVATAARAGAAREAFAVLDASTRRAEFKDPWSVPARCGPADTELAENCVETPKREFATLRGALDWFLRDLGYLPRRR